MKKYNPQILEILILIFLILSAGITLIIVESPGRNDSLPVRILPDWDNLTLIRVERSQEVQGEKIFELERDKDRWVIQPLNRPAGEKELKVLKTQLSSLQPVELIAEEGPYERFGLNEKLQIKVILKTENKREVLLIGSATPSGNYNYIRFENDPAVYTVRGKLHKSLSEKASFYRNRQVLSFKAADIKSLILSRKGDSKVIFRNRDEWWDSNGIIAESAELNSYVSRLSQLKCLSYLEEEESLKLKSQNEPLISLLLKSERASWELKILKENNGNYSAGTEEQADAFLISRYDGDFLKNLSGF
ncbi:MAG: hypothetical protein B6241_00315 [Spirochaetaceae bacterium 4572_59]|nr:MAG: hypothetical protein B6241_00315 [Spirochaetaceae bacterium 4572_59]